MTNVLGGARPLKELINRSLIKKGDESPSLHFIVLLMGWWVAGSLAWIGTPIWIWVGGGLLLTIGHVFSWVCRDLQSRIRTALVALALVGSLALLPPSVMKAVNGEWLPVAYFLLLFQGVSAFEMRSRGGLYASIIVSGAIFFFVSQQALDVTFVIFLTGYTTLLLSFFALSFLLDQVKNADVRWFQNRFGFGLFWSGVFIASMLTSAAIFLLLPKQLIDPINDAHGAVLPMRASDRITIPEVTFEEQSLGAAMPVTASTQESDPSAGLDESTTPSPSQYSGQINPDLPETPELGSEPGFEGQPGIGSGQGTEVGAGSISPEEQMLGPAVDPVVMQVRSPVLTYWRDKTYDTFVNGVWREDRTAWSTRRSKGSRAIYAAPQPKSLRTGPLYNQNFFIKQDLGEGEFFSGYSPLLASIPLAEDGSRTVPAGSTYRVISALPDFSVRNLRNSDPANRMERRYHRLPTDSESIQSVATQITEGAYTDVDRMRRVVTYIDRNYEYDLAALDQSLLSSDPSAFIESQGKGTGMDLATATVLLARGAGIPARLVTGYLPGQFDPLSGTYIVRESDRHTWAEVFFSGSGWVPFDSAPRPSTTGFGEGGTFFDSAPLGAIFSADISEDIYSSVRSTPELLNNLFDEDSLRTAIKILGPATAVLGILMMAFAAWRYAPLLRPTRIRLAYSGLPGDARQDMLKVYFKAEKMLRKKGFPPREPSQTVGEYNKLLTHGSDAEKEDLRWIQKSAWKAAYDPDPYDGSALTEAKDKLAGLKEHLRNRGL